MTCLDCVDEGSDAGERARRDDAPIADIPHFVGATPISAATTASGNDDCAHARSNRALKLVGIRSSSAPRVASSARRCSMSRPVESAPAFTATRQELAASISAFTHCAITERIYVSYSLEVVAGNRSMTDLMASSCASA